MANIWRR